MEKDSGSDDDTQRMSYMEEADQNMRSIIRTKQSDGSKRVQFVDNNDSHESGSVGEPSSPGFKVMTANQTVSDVSVVRLPIIETEGIYFEQQQAVDSCVYMARLMEAGGLIEEMSECAFELIKAKNVHEIRYDKAGESQKADYTKRERDTLYVSFKNLLSSKRVALRACLAIKENPKYTRFLKALDFFIVGLRDEITKTCQ